MRTMKNKKPFLVVLSVVALILVCGGLLTAGPKRLPQIVVGNRPTHVHPLEADSSGLTELYSNLGSRTNAYNTTFAWVVSGPNSPFGQKQWMAMPFTPEADATVIQIKMALFWDGIGTKNSATVIFAADRSGLPGTGLRKWVVNNMKTFGECCSLTTVRAPGDGIKVKKGQLYWLVAKTDSTNDDALDVWAYTWNQATGDSDYNVGDGWKTQTNQGLAAYAIYGTEP